MPPNEQNKNGFIGIVYCQSLKPQRKEVYCNFGMNEGINVGGNGVATYDERVVKLT